MSRLNTLYKTTDGYSYRCIEVSKLLPLKESTYICKVAGDYSCTVCILGTPASEDANLAATTKLLQGTSE